MKSRFSAAILQSLALLLLTQAVFGDQNSEEDDEFVEEWLRGDDLTELEDLVIPDDDWLPPELEIPPLSLWDVDSKISTGTGYRDNVMLSSFEPEGGMFLYGGLDTSILRLPPDGPRFSLLVQLEHLEFLSSRDLPSDTFATAFSQIHFPIRDDLTAALALRAFYLDQVVDVAFLDAHRPVPVRGRGITTGPSLRKEWGPLFFTEAGAFVSRQEFREPIDDYWEGYPHIAAGWAGKTSELSFRLHYAVQKFDNRLAFSEEGESLDGTSLTFRQLRPEAVFRHAWGEDLRWRSRSRLGFDFNRDNKSDYFAYDRLKLSQQFEYGARGWNVEISARYSSYDYRVQKVDGEARERQLWGAGVEVRRTLNKRLDLFARYDWESAHSNEREGEYRVETWTAGLGWQL